MKRTCHNACHWANAQGESKSSVVTGLSFDECTSVATSYQHIEHWLFISYSAPRSPAQKATPPCNCPSQEPLFTLLQPAKSCCSCFQNGFPTIPLPSSLLPPSCILPRLMRMVSYPCFHFCYPTIYFQLIVIFLKCNLTLCFLKYLICFPLISPTFSPWRPGPRIPTFHFSLC